MNKELIKNFLRFKSGIVDNIAGLLPPAMRDALQGFRRECLAGLEEFLKEELAKMGQEQAAKGVKPVTID